MNKKKKSRIEKNKTILFKVNKKSGNYKLEKVPEARLGQGSKKYHPERGWYFLVEQVSS